MVVMVMRHTGKRTSPRSAALCALLAAAVVLGGCAAPRPVDRVIIAWHSLTGAREQALLDLVDRWNVTNPWDITLVPERKDQAALHRAVLAGAGQALPALMLVDPGQAAVYQQHGLLAPLDAFIADASPDVGWSAADRADLFPFVFSAARNVDGQIVGIPFGGAARMFLFNRDWLKSLGIDAGPADWERFGQACARATDRAKGTLCFGASASSDTFADWVLAYGGRLAQTANVVQVATPLSLRAIGQLNSYVRSNQVYRATTARQSQDDFSAGRVLFAFDWSDTLAAYGATIRERGNFDWDIGLLPGDPATRAALFQAPVWVISRAASQREGAAWRFIRWLLDSRQTTEWWQRTGEFPARNSAVAALDALQPAADQRQVAVLKTLAPVAQPAPFVGGWNCIQGVLSHSLREVFDGSPVTDTLQIAQYTAQSEVDFDCSLQ